MKNNNIFEDLFVLEMTNNHLGKIDRAYQIIEEYAPVVRFNNVKAAIKLQFRDVDTFIHKDFKNSDIRQIKRSQETQLSREEYRKIVQYIKQNNMIPMSTPFDENSVDLCVDLGLPIIKIASANVNDWVLLNKVAQTKKPVIASFGGTSLHDCDSLVQFFQNRNIPLAINHCVCTYPTKDEDLQLNQIDFLKERYPYATIGLSTHEDTDWKNSMLISYAKGAKLWERHVDINTDGIQVAKYSSLPHQIDEWFKSYNKVKQICGQPGSDRKNALSEEKNFLDNYIRGVYLKRDMKEGETLTEADIYCAVPLQKGQVSVREVMLGYCGMKLCKNVKKDEPLIIDSVKNEYSKNKKMSEEIYNRGIDRK
jgi:sialic acid synthase SpsE